MLDVGTGSTHDGRLAAIQRVVGTEPVLTDETATLFRAVADRMAGTFSDVARLGVPPRHARAEATHERPGERRLVADTAGWARYQAGPAFVDAVRDGRPARAIWSAMPAEDWPLRLAELAAGRAGAGPRRRPGGPGQPGRTAGRQPVQRGPRRSASTWSSPPISARNAVTATGSRSDVARSGPSSAPAPRPSRRCADPGLLVIWDDGDDLHAEPRAPYPHSRDMLVQRSALAGTALLLGGFARTAEAQLLLESGWAHEIHADRPTVRARAPRVTAVGDDREQARDAGGRGRAAAQLGLAHRAGGARRRRRRARPGAPARLPASPWPARTTGRPRGARSAPGRWRRRPAMPSRPAAGAADRRATGPVRSCGQHRLRAVVVGAARTAEEIGRAFPGVTVRTSGGSNVLADIPPGPALVIATPGAEPAAPEATRRRCCWTAGRCCPALTCARPRRRSGAGPTPRPWHGRRAQVVVGADAAVPAVQALVRWDPAGHAARELADRTELRFLPAERLASVTGAWRLSPTSWPRPSFPPRMTSSAQCPCGTESNACWSGCRARPAPSWLPP